MSCKIITGDKMRNRIKELRDERNMTQVRLSTELSVAQETISAYESGKHFPSVKSLIKMAELFDASCDYILGLNDIRKPLKETLINSCETTLLLLYRGLDKNRQDKAIAYLEGLSDNRDVLENRKQPD